MIVAAVLAGDEDNGDDERKTGGTRDTNEMLYQSLTWRLLSLALWRGLCHISWLVVLHERQGRLHQWATYAVERMGLFVV